MANSSNELEMERRVLQALCQEEPAGLLHNLARKLMRDYHWREPVHQVVFVCLMESGPGNPVGVREHLATCATRKGFPDVDWEGFFKPISVSSPEAEELMRRLRESNSADEEI